MNSPQLLPAAAALATASAALGAVAVARAAAANGRVLVVNTDASIAKYAEVQSSFKEALGNRPLTEIDLHTAGETLLRRALASESPALIHCIGAAAYQAAARLARDHRIVLSRINAIEVSFCGDFPVGGATRLPDGFRLHCSWDSARAVFPKGRATKCVRAPARQV